MAKYNPEYRKAYQKNREKALEKQKEYRELHRDEINKKARNRYRVKCGLPEEK